MAIALVSSGPRVRVVDGQGVTKVVITPQTGLASLVGMIAIFAFWTFGGLFALLMLEVANRSGESGAFFQIWLVAWAVAEFAGLVMIAWRLFGRIVIEARSTGLTVAHRIFFLGSKTTVPASAFLGMAWVPDDRAKTVTVNGQRVPQPALTARATTGSFRIAHGVSRDDADIATAAVRQRLGKARALA